MEKYLRPPPPQPQQQHRELLDYRKRKAFVEDDCRRGTPLKKTKLYSDTQYLLNNEGSKSTFSQGYSSGKISRLQSPSPGFDPSRTHKISHSSSAPSRVNWRLACYMAREYLSRGTLLGKPWPPQDSNMRPPRNPAEEATMKNIAGDEGASKGGTIYSSFTTNFLRSDDIQIPGIINPSQMAAWLGLI